MILIYGDSVGGVIDEKPFTPGGDGSMPLYIPTLGRVAKQKTYRLLPDTWKSRVTFVVHAREADAFLKTWQFGEDRIVVVDKVGAPHARKTAIDDAARRGFHKIFMLDDDLRFCYRPDDWQYKIKDYCGDMTPEVLDKALCTMELCLNHYVHCGFGARAGNQAKPQLHVDFNGRLMRSFGVRVDVLKEKGIDIAKYPYWEDFHVVLSLLRRGYPNYVSLDYTTDGYTNTEGGCSLYRDEPTLRATRIDFLAEHGKFAKKNDKPAKTWGQGFANAETAPDMIIQWKKAFEERDLYGK